MIEEFIKRRRAELEARDGGRWMIQKRAEINRRLSPAAKAKIERILSESRQRRSGLFIVPKPKPEPEQLDLGFDGENEREIERAMSEVLERAETRRKPKAV
jgi:hypothetical protein